MSFFSLPGRLKADDLKIKVVARRDGFLQEAKVEVAPIYLNQILVSTDKPLYQPGQTLRVRVLALDRDRKAGIEGILQRPYGCAEQTISSTYPIVMILRHLEPQSEKLSAPMRKIAEKARRYAQAGYERLLGYRAEKGGFSYWGRGEADLALTAYALRFLNDASDFIGVDEDVIADARKFILGSQERDGGWAPRY